MHLSRTRTIIIIVIPSENHRRRPLLFSVPISCIHFPLGYASRDWAQRFTKPPEHPMPPPTTWRLKQHTESHFPPIFPLYLFAFHGFCIIISTRRRWSPSNYIAQVCFFTKTTPRLEQTPAVRQAHLGWSYRKKRTGGTVQTRLAGNGGFLRIASFLVGFCAVAKRSFGRLISPTRALHRMDARTRRCQRGEGGLAWLGLASYLPWLCLVLASFGLASFSVPLEIGGSEFCREGANQQAPPWAPKT